jgi:hypothetical protein
VESFAKPTLEECKAWRDTLDGEWGKLDSLMQESEDLYFQNFEIETHNEVEPVKTGSAPADADDAIDALSPQDLQIQVRPSRDKDKYKEQAETLTRWAKAITANWRRRRDPLRTLASDQVIRGLAVARIMLDRSRLPRDKDHDGWNITRRGQCPIVFQRRNPRHVRWRTDDEGNLLAVTESYQTTALEAKLAFGAYRAIETALKGKDPNDPVDVADIWVGDYRCLLVNDRPMFAGEGATGKHKGVLPHTYPTIPYVIAPFRELGFDDPDQRYRGLFFNTTQLYKMESNAVTMHLNMMRFNAYRTWIGWTADGHDIQMIPGTVEPIAKHRGEYLEAPNGPSTPPEVLQTAGMFSQLIQRNSVSGTGGETRSAEQVWALQGIRQAKLTSAGGSLSALWWEAMVLATWIADDMFGEPLILPVPGKDRNGVFLKEVRITPEIIDGYYEGFEVAFGRRLDPALLEQWKTLSMLAGNSFLPLDQAWLIGGVTDTPREFERALMRQAMERIPWMVEIGAANWAKEYFEPDSWQVRAIDNKLEESQGTGNQQKGSPGVPQGGQMEPTSGAMSQQPPPQGSPYPGPSGGSGGGGGGAPNSGGFGGQAGRNLNVPRMRRGGGRGMGGPPQPGGPTIG